MGTERLKSFIEPEEALKRYYAAIMLARDTYRLAKAPNPYLEPWMGTSFTLSRFLIFLPSPRGMFSNNNRNDPVFTSIEYLQYNVWR